MSFLIDTDTCSAHIKGDRRVVNRFLQYGGRLFISMITMAELYVWASRTKAPPHRQQDVKDLLTHCTLLELSHDVARKYGEVQARLMDRGLPAPQMDLLIAATALTHGLVLITHNMNHYSNVSGLTIDDWLVP